MIMLEQDIKKNYKINIKKIIKNYLKNKLFELKHIISIEKLKEYAMSLPNKIMVEIKMNLKIKITD